MIRRVIDVGVAALVLSLFSPLFLLVSLAVAIESPGKPFYGGWRVGLRGRRFRIWKFRTMVRNADRIGTAITTRHDPRITRLGKFLRAAKLDELPQFFNLLLGDLTLIGPRPEAPEFVEQYRPEQRDLLNVKPGITGPTQLQYTILEAELLPDKGDAATFYVEQMMADKIRLDLEYQRQRTFVSDCRILFETILLMLRALMPDANRERTRGVGELI